jgi:hypothetical protein
VVLELLGRKFFGPLENYPRERESPSTPSAPQAEIVFLSPEIKWPFTLF